MINQTFVSLKLLFLSFDKGIKGGGSPINGAINGAEDENSLFHRVGDKDDGGSKDPSDNSYLEAEAKLMANGRQISPKLEYDSVKVPGDDKEMDEPSGKKSHHGYFWHKLSTYYYFAYYYLGGYIWFGKIVT